MKKKRPGRPPAKNPASARFEVRCTIEQKRRWSAAAEKSGQSLASWLKAISDKNA